MTEYGYRLSRQSLIRKETVGILMSVVSPSKPSHGSLRPKPILQVQSLFYFVVNVA